MADPSPGGTPGWRANPGSGGPAARPAKAGRGKRLFLTLAGLLAMLGAVVGFLLYLRPAPRPTFVTLWITEYRDPAIPPIPFAEQDRAALSALPWEKSNGFSSQEKDRLTGELDRLGKEPPASGVAVYLSGYVVADAEGRPCLLPGDAGLDGESSWLPMSLVLERLRDCHTSHKLLVLDVMYPLIVPRRGLLAADAAGLLRGQLEEATKDGTLFVLCAAAPGQTALTSEELGHTVFAHYVQEGLLGAADGFLDRGQRDQRVTVRELAAFVAARVDRWADMNRAARQTPELFGSGKDFDLVTYSGQAAPVADTPLPDTYPDWALAGWKLRDDWRALPSSRTRPVRRSAVEEATLRAEARWRGGAASEATGADLSRRLDGFRRDGPDNAPVALVGRPRSLAEAVAAGSKPPDLAAGDLLAKYRALAARAVVALAAKPDDPARAALEMQRAEFLKGFEGKSFDLGWLVVDRAVAEREPSRLLVQFWDDLLQSDPGLADYDEVRALHRLAELAKNEALRTWPARAVADAIHVARDGARLDAAPTWADPWIGPGRRDALQRRQTAAGRLLDPKPAAQAEAATALAALRADLEARLRQGDDLANACRARDDALGLLPGLAAYVELDASQERPWVDAAEGLQELQGLLVRGQPGDLRRLSQAAGDLAEQVQRLRAPFDQPRWAAITAEPHGVKANDARTLAALLASPWPSAVQRTALWQAYRKGAAQLWQDTRTRDQAENHPEAPRTSGLLAPDPRRGADDERKRCLFRARMAIALMKVDGLADAGAVEAAYAAAARNPSDDTNWQALRRQLRKAAQALPAVDAGGDR